jgi:ribonuclease T2
MKPACVLLLSALVCSPLLSGCNARPQPAATESRSFPAGPERVQERVERPRTENPAFDFYLLNLSWSPEFCTTHQNAPECAKHQEFVMHGLWPERTNGTYPENCGGQERVDVGRYADLYPDPGLVEHEWREHGTCSGLSPDAYFGLARAALHKVKVPGAFRGLNHPVTTTPQKLTAMFAAANPGLSADNIRISCGNNYLTAVELCLDKNLKATSCGAVRGCQAQTIRIPPPGQSSASF